MEGAKEAGECLSVSDPPPSPSLPPSPVCVTDNKNYDKTDRKQKKYKIREGREIHKSNNHKA